MSVLLAAAGIALVGVVSLDVVWTTLAVGGGGGPITNQLARQCWRLALRWHDAASLRSHRRLRVVGIGILLAVLATWVLLLWAAWVLVFSADPDALVASSTDDVATLADRAYVVGYSLFTLGNGDFRPTAWPSQLALVACTASGLLVISLGITFLVSVVSASTQRRELAGFLSTLGRRAEDIVSESGTAGQEELFRSLSTLPQLLSGVGRREFAYPVLPYLHAVDRAAAVAPAIAAVDEAVLILTAGIDPSARPPEGRLGAVERAIGDLLESLGGRFFLASDRPPPAPDLELVRRRGLDTVDDATFHAAVAARANRRRLLAGFVAHDGWTWDAVSHAGSNDPDAVRQAGRVGRRPRR